MQRTDPTTPQNENGHSDPDPIPGGTLPRKGAPTGTLGRHLALVRGGWLAILKPTQLEVWLVYNSFADAEGKAWPSVGKIAQLIGHKNTNRVSIAKSELIAFRLLRVEHPANTTTKKSDVMMILDPPPTECAPPTESVRHPPPIRYGDPPPNARGKEDIEEDIEEDRDGGEKNYEEEDYYTGARESA